MLVVLIVLGLAPSASAAPDITGPAFNPETWPDIPHGEVIWGSRIDRFTMRHYPETLPPATATGAASLKDLTYCQLVYDHVTSELAQLAVLVATRPSPDADLEALATKIKSNDYYMLSLPYRQSYVWNMRGLSYDPRNLEEADARSAYLQEYRRWMSTAQAQNAFFNKIKEPRYTRATATAFEHYLYYLEIMDWVYKTPDIDVLSTIRGETNFPSAPAWGDGKQAAACQQTPGYRILRQQLSESPALARVLDGEELLAGAMRLAHNGGYHRFSGETGSVPAMVRPPHPYLPAGATPSATTGAPTMGPTRGPSAAGGVDQVCCPV